MTGNNGFSNAKLCKALGMKSHTKKKAAEIFAPEKVYRPNAKFASTAFSFSKGRTSTPTSPPTVIGNAGLSMAPAYDPMHAPDRIMTELADPDEARRAELGSTATGRRQLAREDKQRKLAAEAQKLEEQKQNRRGYELQKFEAEKERRMQEKYAKDIKKFEQNPGRKVNIKVTKAKVTPFMGYAPPVSSRSPSIASSASTPTAPVSRKRDADAAELEPSPSKDMPKAVSRPIKKMRKQSQQSLGETARTAYDTPQSNSPPDPTSARSPSNSPGLIIEDSAPTRSMASKRPDSTQRKVRKPKANAGSSGRVTKDTSKRKATKDSPKHATKLYNAHQSVKYWLTLSTRDLGNVLYERGLKAGLDDEMPKKDLALLLAKQDVLAAKELAEELQRDLDVEQSDVEDEQQDVLSPVEAEEEPPGEADDEDFFDGPMNAAIDAEQAQEDIEQAEEGQPLVEESEESEEE